MRRQLQKSGKTGKQDSPPVLPQQPYPSRLRKEFYTTQPPVQATLQAPAISPAEAPLPPATPLPRQFRIHIGGTAILSINLIGDGRRDVWDPNNV